MFLYGVYNLWIATLSEYVEWTFAYDVKALDGIKLSAWKEVNLHLMKKLLDFI